MSKQKKNFLIKKIQKIITTVFVLAVVIIFAITIKVSAGTDENSSGWLWGGSDDGVGNPIGLGWISLNNTNIGSAVSYGLTIPASGEVSGYVWSENLGYIDFNPQAHCGSAYMAASCLDPDGTTGGVNRFGNDLIGWARFVEIAKASATNNSGGWSGWIKMNGSNYGVILDDDNRQMSGYAWSDELGYINFKGTNYGAGYIPQVCVPNYTSYNCSLSSDNGACNIPQNCGTTQTIKTPICNRSDSNNCPDNPFPTVDECIVNSALCPESESEQCPSCPLKIKSWKEVAP
jgi:hypothetical protein